MIEYLNKINRKYDLNIGNYCFSPILQSSIALSLEYVASIENAHNREPFHICFPEKEYSSLWLSIALLKNFFHKDYDFKSQNRIEELGLKSNDKIELFGCVVRYVGMDGDKRVWIKFKDDNLRLCLKTGSIPYINKTNRKALNTHGKFKSKRRELISQRNAISKIIIPKDDILINQQILISKVMVVAGRGNTNKLLEKMKSTEVHNESLFSAFQVNKDLIIKPDLDDYKSCFDSEHSDKKNHFKRLFLDSFERVKNLLDEEFDKDFIGLKQDVDNDQFDDEHFLKKYDEFLENLERSYHQILFNVRDRHPGISTSLPGRLKAIIVNDIELLGNYAETIKGFINKKIPVIVVSDRNIGSKNFYDNFFSEHPNSLRINWNRKKISELQKRNSQLPVEGKDLDGVQDAITFLESANIHNNAKVGSTVLVIGGGAVAMDCAKTALRLGSEEAHIVCLESRSEMSTSDCENERTLQEKTIVITEEMTLGKARAAGATLLLHTSVGPKRIVGTNGKVLGLEILKVKSVFDSQGRFNLTFHEGSESTLGADTIILAISEGFLDQQMWDSCKRYAEQQIEVEIFEGHPLDTILPETRRLIFNLEGFEKLKKAYWKYFLHAAYGVKNDFANNHSIKLWTEQFEEEYVNVKNLLDAGVSDVISEGLRLINEYKENTKKLNETIPVFAENYGDLNGHELLVPSCCALPRIKNLSAQTYKILFTGHPLKEPRCKVLENSVCEYLIPEIKILAWPMEGDFVYKCLFGRLYGAYFTDYLNEAGGFSDDLLLTNKQDFEDEIVSFLKKTGRTQISGSSSDDEKDIILAISSYKYNQYHDEDPSAGTYMVKCNIVDFDDDQFMFVPHKSKVLTQIETSDGSVRFKRASFEELKVGYKIYEYKFNRTQRMGLLKRKLGSHEELKNLNLWRDYLEFLHGELKVKLEDELSAVMDHYGLDGNPSSANIQRWLHDEEMLSPEDDNLRIIFTAYAPYVEDVELEDVELFVTKVRKAYKIINSFNIGLSHKIKKLIIDRLNKIEGSYEKRFQINIQGFDLNIATATVIDLQKNDKLINYHDTRKILV